MVTFSSVDDRVNGVAVAADWITDLESSDSRLHKERVIEKALMASRLGSSSAQAFLFNAYLAYNPYFTYHIKQVPEVNGQIGRPNPWTKFWALCEALRTRSVTGHEARDMVKDIAAQFDDDEWNHLARRVLIKDLRCGISEKTLNKILGKTEWAIPVFTCQLAQDSTDQASKMRGKKRIEVKLDGVRVLAVVNSNKVVLFSRNGKEFLNFPDIAETIQTHWLKFANAVKSKSFVLDGEIVGESFQNLMKQAHRKSDAKTSDMVYHVFDIIPFEDFQRGFWNAQQHKRQDVLDNAKTKLPPDLSVRIMAGLLVDLDTSEGHDIMHRFAQDAVTAGFEGIMIKDINAPYECKRSSFWLKWKPTISVDLQIVGFEQGTGRNKTRLGAIICEGDDNGRSIRVNVGSGFTDNDRNEFWAVRDTLIGHLVEIQADAVTQNQDGTYSLRFPRFLRFRDFEIGEKI